MGYLVTLVTLGSNNSWDGSSVKQYCNSPNELNNPAP